MGLHTGEAFPRREIVPPSRHRRRLGGLPIRYPPPPTAACHRRLTRSWPHAAGPATSGPVLGECWASAGSTGPALTQHWACDREMAGIGSVVDRGKPPTARLPPGCAGGERPAGGGGGGLAAGNLSPDPHHTDPPRLSSPLSVSCRSAVSCQPATPRAMKAHSSLTPPPPRRLSRSFIWQQVKIGRARSFNGEALIGFCGAKTSWRLKSVINKSSPKTLWGLKSVIII